MWAIRILTGPQAGQIFNLKTGRNRFGRGSEVDFQINSNGISKEHFEISVQPEKVIITDLKSSNGTFVNGVQIQSQVIRLGDKLSAHNVLFDLVLAQERRPVVAQSRPSMGPMSYPPSAAVNSLPPAHPAHMRQGPVGESYGSSSPSEQQASSFDNTNFKDRLSKIFDEVFMPSIYQLAKAFELKILIAGFVAVFVLAVALLSVLPMNQITAETIETESRRRAVTVARSLAAANEKIVRSGDISRFSTDLMLREDGISDVYIVSKEGVIVAPAERVGMRPREAGFINELRGMNTELSAKISSDKIGAGVPILVFDAEFQQNVAKAYAVVIYNPGSLAFNDGRALSLFIQMLVFSLVLGFVLFWVLYKVVEYPFITLRDQLNEALVNGRDHADVDVNFPVMEEVMVGVNSILSRLVQVGGNNLSAAVSSSVKDTELINLVNLIPYPAILVNKDRRILAENSVFEQVTNLSNLAGQTVNYIPDQAMQKNFSALMDTASQSSAQTQSDQIELNGQQFSVTCQAVSSSTSADYFIIMLAPFEISQGGAA